MGRKGDGEWRKGEGEGRRGRGDGENGRRREVEMEERLNVERERKKGGWSRKRNGEGGGEE